MEKLSASLTVKAADVPDHEVLMVVAATVDEGRVLLAEAA